MNLATIIVILLVLALVGVLPLWPYSARYGYGPSGGVGFVLLVLIVLLLLGKL